MERHGYAGPSVLTALVVDDSCAARARITTLLHLGGWRVHQAVGTEDALRVAALVEPDLVVTDMVMRNGHGATLMRRLREQGSSARFLVIAARRTHQARALAAATGALACLAKPVDPRLFVDVMRGLAPTAAAPVPDKPAPRPAPEVAPQTEQLFLGSLPLAAATERLGHTEVAFVSHAIAPDARRGTITRERLITLVELCARLEPSALVQAATSR